MEKDVHSEHEIPGLSREQPMEVPDGYFEALPDRIMARLPEPELAVKPWYLQWQVWRVTLPVAAAIVLVITLVFPANIDLSADSNTLAAIDEDELVTYLTNALDTEDLMSYDLAYTSDAEEIIEELWGENEEGISEDYLDDITLEDLEGIDLEDVYQNL